jgi:glutathionylspermidine synthase
MLACQEAGGPYSKQCELILGDFTQSTSFAIHCAPWLAYLKEEEMNLYIYLHKLHRMFLHVVAWSIKN